MEGRLHQAIVVLKKLRDDLGLPYESEEVQAVKQRFDEFIRTGEPWEGKIPFSSWDRIAHIRLTSKGKIELTLQVQK
jgi:hypothetical protein